MSVEAESVEGTVDGEEVGELPKMRDMSKRRAHRYRKQHHQMKELIEERAHLGQTLEGYMASFQDQQQHMIELERQVEQMKDRERQKAIEIQKWQSTADDRGKESMKLKKQLAVAMERLSRSEKSLGAGGASDPAAVRAAMERMEMRVADYESLISEFAWQTEMPTAELEGSGVSGQASLKLAQQDRTVFQTRMNSVMEHLQQEISNSNKLSDAHERLLRHSEELQTRVNSLQQELADAQGASGQMQVAASNIASLQSQLEESHRLAQVQRAEADKALADERAKFSAGCKRLLPRRLSWSQA